MASAESPRPLLLVAARDALRGLLRPAGCGHGTGSRRRAAARSLCPSVRLSRLSAGFWVSCALRSQLPLSLSVRARPCSALGPASQAGSPRPASAPASLSLRHAAALLGQRRARGVQGAGERALPSLPPASRCRSPSPPPPASPARAPASPSPAV